MHVIPVFPLVLLLVSAVSCSSVRTAEDPTKPSLPRTTVEVRNLQHSDFDIYVLTGTHRLRLGRVSALTSRSFVIPPHLLGEQAMLRFGLGSTGFNRRVIPGEEQVVHAGEQLSLAIRWPDFVEPPLRISFADEPLGAQ